MCSEARPCAFTGSAHPQSDSDCSFGSRLEQLAGWMSLRQMGMKHNCSHSAIANREFEKR